MPRKTEYQKQADKRTRDALRLRAKFDARIRKYMQQLVAAAEGALDARNRILRVNALYGVDLSTETLLAHDVRVANYAVTLGMLVAGSTPGEEVQLFNATADGNGGAVLANEALFGEPGSAVPTETTNP